MLGKLTLPVRLFFLKNVFFTVKAVFWMPCCQMPLNFATKAFSYNLARFWTSFCCKLYNILLSRMRISRIFFLADSFPIFFSLPLLSFFSPFLFSWSSTLYPLSIHWKSFGLSPSKKLEMEHWSTRTWPILPLILHPNLDKFFLPEFGRYLTRTQVWMDLSLLC